MHKYSHVSRARFVQVAVATLTLSACDQRSVAPPIETGLNRAFVTGDAAAALDADGRFVLSFAKSWSRPELTEAEARRFGDVYVTQFVPTLPGFFERSHGQSIDFASLRSCGRAFYALSPYVEPSADVIQAFVNQVSPRWLFTYCNASGLPSVSVGVAATATHLTINNGTLDRRSLRGGEFQASGIPAGSWVPLTPEEAVARLSEQSRRRISAVPRLVLPGMPYVAQSSRWQLDLETAAPARSASGSVLERRFYVGWAFREWKIETSRGRSRAPGDMEEEVTLPSGQVVLLVRASGVPRAFESVTFGGRP
jgi:hypothetical protein